MKAKTKKALSGLDWAIAQTVEEPKQADEFTTDDFARAGNLPVETARDKLNRMVRDGHLTKRMITLNGTRTNLYRKV
jgi:hypothetical protein